MNTVMIREDGNWYSVKEMCELSNTSRQTWMNFKSNSNCKTTFTVRRNLRKGDKNVEYYQESVFKQFQMWLKKNAMNAGGQRTEGSIIKQDNQQDLFIGCVATKGTPDEIRSLARFLDGVAEQKEQLEIAANVNHQLQLENKQLANENDYLKKLNEINTSQLSYYTNRYHSWQDDYENY